MCEQEAHDGGEVRPWVLSEEFTRYLIRETKKQPRRWVAAWLAIALGVTVVLALASAATPAYFMPPVTVVVALIASPA